MLDATVACKTAPCACHAELDFNRHMINVKPLIFIKEFNEIMHNQESCNHIEDQLASIITKKSSNEHVACGK